VQHFNQHSPARGAPVGGARPKASCRGLGSLIASLAVMTVCGGCSMSFPIASMQPGADEMTASIKPVIGKMSDEEDRRRAKAALSTALDPQGDGHAVRWENPTTGDKGSFTAVGHAYPLDSRVCRAFLGTAVQNGEDKTFQGTACTVAAGEWAVTETKPFKKS
jgi:surface antigen